MKILESQQAVLTNYEVYQHILEQRARYAKTKRRGPGNYKTLVDELQNWLERRQSPLSQKPTLYNEKCIATLLERLRPYELPKSEVVMILNVRPPSASVLNAIIEDMYERFTEEQLEDIMNIIFEVLGQFPPAETNEDEVAEDAGEDVQMADEAAAGGSAS
jgi:DNA-directed RNA polymerase subunit F